MFCQKCGTSMPDDSKSCPSCGQAVAAPAEPATASGSHAHAGVLAYQAKEAGLEAWKVIKNLALNPVAGLAPAYEALGDSKARNVGLVFGGVGIICQLVGGYFVIPSEIRKFFSEMLGFSGFMKLVISACLPFICVAAGNVAARMGLKGKGGLGGDIFMAGASLLPIGLLSLWAGIVGIEHYNLIGIVLVFAVSTTILMLFAGLTRITQLSERLGTVVTPGVIVIAMWLATSVMTSMSPSESRSSSPRFNPRSSDAPMFDPRMFDK